MIASTYDLINGRLSLIIIFDSLEVLVKEYIVLIIYQKLDSPVIASAYDLINGRLSLIIISYWLEVLVKEYILLIHMSKT